MNQATTRIEVRPDIDGGWAVTRNCIVDGYFSDVTAANDYAHACAHRAKRAGLMVSLHTGSASPQGSASEVA